MTIQEVTQGLLKLKDKADSYENKCINKAVEIIDNYEWCRNELCQKCGRYTESHLGACDGCRWKR